jgi:hypothetical protein
LPLIVDPVDHRPVQMQIDPDDLLPAVPSLTVASFLDGP